MGQSNAAAKYFQVPISQKKPNLSEVWNENFAVFDQKLKFLEKNPF